MKFIIISPKNRTTFNFRGDLLIEIVNRGYEVIATGPNDDYIDEIFKLGVRFEKVPFDKNGMSILSDLKYCFKLYNLFRKEKPDITFGYTIKPVIYGAIAAKLAGVKNINSMVTGAGYVFTAKSIKAKILKLIVSILYKIGFSCANTIIFQNKDDLNQFSQMKIVEKRKCELINGSGVNMNLFEIQPYPNEINFFMLSRVMRSKGVLEYLQASKKVKAKYPNVRFVLLGAVEEIQDSLSFEDISTYIDDGIIEYFGESKDVRPYYKDCSVYVLPSYREGTPRTVLEAMSMGRPIITTNVPGCKETVEDGVNGFLVPVRDFNSLAEKMIWFIENPSQIEIMGKKSFEICREKFEVGKVNAVMMKYMKIEELNLNEFI